MNNFKKAVYGASLFFMVAVLAACGSKNFNSVSLKTSTDSASYYLGYAYGKNIVNSDIDDFNVGAMGKGIQNAMDKVEISDEEINMFLQQYFDNLQATIAAKYLKEGQDFLENNKKKENIVTLPSGVQYRVIKEGTGIKPTKEDMVNVVYHGTLIDGTVFDSTKERQDTATFGVSGVVPGFSEALTLMNEGSVWEVFIPSELAYGLNPPGGPLKPNSVLIFELDLVKVVKTESAE